MAVSLLVIYTGDHAADWGLWLPPPGIQSEDHTTRC